MLDGIYNRPNTIIERQRIAQNDHRPVHYKAPRRALYFRLFGVGFAAGTLGSVYGLYSLIRGKSD